MADTTQSNLTAEDYRRMHPYCWRCGYMFLREPVTPCRCGAMEEAIRPQKEGNRDG